MTEPRSVPSGALLLACVLASGAAWGQTSATPSAASSAAERAQKETDRTMYWIRVLADKPAPVKPAPAAKPAAVAAAPVAKPAAEPRDKPKAAPTPAASPAPVAAQSTRLAQAPAGDAPEPSALSSPRADNAAAATSAAPLSLEATPTPEPEPDPGLIQTKSVQPDFPIVVVQRARKGNVEVQFEVEPGGKVVDAAVVESSNSHLNNAALEAIRQWRFQPTAKSHTAVVNLVFNIDNEK